MSKRVSLTWEEFEEQFKPISNKFSRDPNQKMFETYGEELDFVRSAPENCIWTHSQIDYGFMTSEGYHFVNRLGYYVTEIPFEPDTSYEIDLYIETCEKCGNELDDDAWSCSEDDGEYTCNNCCGHEDCK